MVDEAPVPDEVTVPLDAYANLLAQLDECRDEMDYWKHRADQIKTRLGEIMGEATVGTVDGQPVVTYRYENRFRGGDFKRAYPDTYRYFTHEKTVKQFDVDWFKQTKPDLYEQFRVRSFKSNFETGKKNDEAKDDDTTSET